MFLFSIFLSIFLLKSSLVNASYNGLSIVNLAALAKSEVLISTEIHKLAKESSHFVKSFPYVPEYLEDYKLARGNLDVWDVASNPIAAYAMISRYVYLLDKLMGDIHQRGNYGSIIFNSLILWIIYLYIVLDTNPSSSIKIQILVFTNFPISNPNMNEGSGTTRIQITNPGLE